MVYPERKHLVGGLDVSDVRDFPLDQMMIPSWLVCLQLQSPSAKGHGGRVLSNSRYRFECRAKSLRCQLLARPKWTGFLWSSTWTNHRWFCLGDQSEHDFFVFCLGLLHAIPFIYDRHGILWVNHGLNAIVIHCLWMFVGIFYG